MKRKILVFGLVLFIGICLVSVFAENGRSIPFTVARNECNGMEVVGVREVTTGIEVIVRNNGVNFVWGNVTCRVTAVYEDGTERTGSEQEWINTPGTKTIWLLFRWSSDVEFRY